MTAHSRTSGQSVPGAHVWIIFALLLLTQAAAGQQGGQTSSTPPLTGAGAPPSGCGVGSLYVNTTTGDLYDCNAGSWLKVNGGGSGAFSGGLGSSYQDATEISAPANPASGNDRLYLSSSTHLLACVTSGGANCMPAGGAGTVTQVTSGNFSPLFNVSVATNTTTPAFSFATINQSANTVYGNCTGSTGAPAFCALTAGMLPTLSITANGQTCTIGSTCNVNAGAAAHSVALNQGNGNALTGPALGNAGQVLESNGPGAYPSFQDPIVSYAYINLFNVISATGTQTSSVTRDSTFGQYGTLIATWASITGSPSGCTIQIKSADSQGNLVNNGSAVSVTPANGTNGIAFTPAASLQTASQMQAVYACSTTYPSGGTLTLDFAPAISTAVINTPSVNATLQASAGTDIGKLDSNQSVNEAQINGHATAECGVNGCHAVGGNQADGSALSGNPVPMAGKGSGNARIPIVCDNWKPFSFASTSNQLLVSGAASKKIYICSINVVVAAATNVALVEGTTTTNPCDTGTAGMAGGATAATGWNFAANGGLAQGSGIGAIAITATAADNVCLFASAANQVSGVISWTQF